MTDQELLDRITCDPSVMVGKPVVRGTRLTVDFLLELLAHDVPEDEIMSEYPGLQKEDIQACLLFAARTLSSSSFLPLAESA